MITVKRPSAPSVRVDNNAPVSNPSQMQNVSKVVANTPMVSVAGEANYKPQVPAMTKTVTSATGGGAAAVTAYFLNEDVYNATPTNNGSGMLSVVGTYGDGWSGGGYNRLAMLEGGNNGISCYGLTLVYTVISSSAQDGSALSTANPTWLMANLVGNRQVPVGLVLAAGTRNTQYLQGTMTVDFKFNLSPLNQLSYNVPVGDSVALTVLTQPLS